MKTLYVSDLDGTLLRSDQKTSEFTNATINELVKNGMLFSYATARSWHTAHKVTEGMTAAFPLIVYNGAFILDNASGKHLLENFFKKASAITMIHELIDGGMRNKMFPCGKSIFIGNDHNDLSGFEACDMKVAVANAETDLLEKADIVIPSNNDDGVARFLDHLCGDP